MKTSRRDFLRVAGLAGVGLAATQRTGAAASPPVSALDHIRQQALEKHRQTFNMCGFVAPALDKVRIGTIGIGARGSAAVERTSHIEGVVHVAICDLVEAKVTAANAALGKLNQHPKAYFGSDDTWKALCERDDIDLIYICTPWALHTPMAVYAMEQGKHVAVEVPAATSLEQCWQLVTTSEHTKKHCMMLENCCYDFFTLMTLNMARQGFYGEIIHAEGGYIHDRLDKVFRNDPWRLMENVRKGNVYPTHGLGPLCQLMNINRGARMDYMVSMSSDDFSMLPTARRLAAADPKFKRYAELTYRGNMNTSTIRTNRGQTLVIQHDCSSRRVYSRLQVISGTNGASERYPLPGRVTQGEHWLPPKDVAALEDKYLQPSVRAIRKIATKVGGHDGMDLVMDWRLIDCLRHGVPLDMNAYDAATWSVIAPLSEWSVANRSAPIDVPDFTCGAWEKNAPLSADFSNHGTSVA